MRQGSVERKTNETNISGKVTLAGTGSFEISSNPFFSASTSEKYLKSLPLMLIDFNEL